MKKGQNTRHAKFYFQDGLTNGSEAAAIAKARNMGKNTTLISKNVARASKKKRK